MSSSQFFCCPRFCPTRVSYCTVHSLFCPNETEFYVFTPKQLYLHCFQLIKWDGHEKRFTGGKDTSHLYLWIFAETFSMFFFFSNFQITHQDLKSCDSLTAGIPNFAIFPEIKMLHWIEGKNSCQTQIAGFPESKFAQDSSISYFFFFFFCGKCNQTRALIGVEAAPASRDDFMRGDRLMRVHEVWLTGGQYIAVGQGVSVHDNDDMTTRVQIGCSALQRAA